MIRFFRLMVENPGMLVQMLPALILLIFTFTIARYCMNKFQNSASKIMMAGAILQGIQFLYFQYLSHWMMNSMGHKDLALYFGISSALFFVSEGLFLFGIWKLVKGLSMNKENEFGSGQAEGLFIKK